LYLIKARGEHVLKLIKNYFLGKLLEARLFFIRKHTAITDFFDQIKSVKKILIIMPIKKKDNRLAQKFMPQIRKIFDSAKISTLHIKSLRKTDTNWLGIPNSAFLNKISEEKFDLIIDLNSYHDRLCTYLSALTESKMRVHLTEGKFDKIYNLQFRTNSDDTTITRYNNMLNYLSIMRDKKIEPVEEFVS
jgi:hypothetical protein